MLLAATVGTMAIEIFISTKAHTYIFINSHHHANLTQLSSLDEKTHLCSTFADIGTWLAPGKLSAMVSHQKRRIHVLFKCNLMGIRSIGVNVKGLVLYTQADTKR
jgi:hypothetical protein